MRKTTLTILLSVLCALVGCDSEGGECSLCDPGDTCDGSRECLQFEDFLYRCAHPGDTCTNFFDSPLDPGLQPMPVDSGLVEISEQPSPEPEPGFSPVDP